MVPELFDLFLLAQDHVRARVALGEESKLTHGARGPGFNEGGMADEGDAFKASLGVAAAIEGAAVMLALQSVIADEAGQTNGVDGTF